MIPRGTWPALIPAAVVLALLVSLLSWGARGHRNADRQRTRADSLATEIAASQLRELGWVTTLAGVTRDLTRRLDDSVSAVLEAARAEPIIRTVVETSASGATHAPRDPARGSPGSTVYRVDDGPLSGVITTWADSALARLEWQVEISAELVHSVAADGRLLLAARSTDPRVVLEVPELAWSPPPPPPGPSRLRWLLGGIVVGVIGWEIVR